MLNLCYSFCSFSMHKPINASYNLNKPYQHFNVRTIMNQQNVFNILLYVLLWIDKMYPELKWSDLENKSIWKEKVINPINWQLCKSETTTSLTSRTCFIDNLPPNISIPNFLKIWNHNEHVHPQKVQTQPQAKICLRLIPSPHILLPTDVIRYENGRKFGPFAMHVCSAKRDWLKPTSKNTPLPLHLKSYPNYQPKTSDPKQKKILMAL